MAATSFTYTFTGTVTIVADDGDDIPKEDRIRISVHEQIDTRVGNGPPPAFLSRLLSCRLFELAYAFKSDPHEHYLELKRMALVRNGNGILAEPRRQHWWQWRPWRKAAAA